MKWETVYDEGDGRAVRRIKCEGGWIYQVQVGMQYGGLEPTYDNGKFILSDPIPIFGNPVFIPDLD